MSDASNPIANSHGNSAKPGGAKRGPKAKTQSLADIQRELELQQTRIAEADGIAAFAGLSVSAVGEQTLVLQGEGKLTITAECAADLDRLKGRMIGAGRAPLHLQGAA